MTRLFQNFGWEQQYKLPAKLEEAGIHEIPEEEALLEVVGANIAEWPRLPGRAQVYFCPVSGFLPRWEDNCSRRSIARAKVQLSFELTEVPEGVGLSLYAKVHLNGSTESPVLHVTVIGVRRNDGLLHGRDSLPLLLNGDGGEFAVDQMELLHAV